LLAPADDAIARVVSALSQIATNTASATVAAQPLLLLLRPPPDITPEVAWAHLPSGLADAHIVGTDMPTLADIEGGDAAPGFAVLVDSAPTLVDPAKLVAAGTRLLLGRANNVAFERWRRFPVAGPSVLTLHMTTVTADPFRPQRLYQHLRERSARDGMAAVELNLMRLSDLDEMNLYLSELAGWLASQPMRLISLQEAASQLAAQLLEVS
jgi:hypothetical protein